MRLRRRFLDLGKRGAGCRVRTREPRFTNKVYWRRGGEERLPAAGRQKASELHRGSLRKACARSGETAGIEAITGCLPAAMSSLRRGRGGACGGGSWTWGSVVPAAGFEPATP